MPPPPGRLRNPSTELAVARTTKAIPTAREKTLARTVAMPKRMPPSVTTPLATAKKMVNEFGPLSSAWFDARASDPGEDEDLEQREAHGERHPPAAQTATAPTKPRRGTGTRWRGLVRACQAAGGWRLAATRRPGRRRSSTTLRPDRRAGSPPPPSWPGRSPPAAMDMGGEPTSPGLRRPGGRPRGGASRARAAGQLPAVAQVLSLRLWLKLRAPCSTGADPPREVRRLGAGLARAGPSW